MLRVLLIEDSDSDAFIIQKALEDHAKGVKCMRAENLCDGEAMLKKGGFDVVLLDLGLPDSAGPEDSYARIAKCAAATPIVVSTSVNDHELAKSLVHDGAEDYMSKDVIADKPEHVRDAVEFAIERHAQLHKAVSEKEKAVRDSQQKDTVINCFMGGYSVSEDK